VAAAWLQLSYVTGSHDHPLAPRNRRPTPDALPEDDWRGRTGFVHRAVLEDFPDLSGYQVYACGAPIVVDSARAEYSAKAKLPPEEFYADSFTSEADKHGKQA
jgi:CDP-4-dehydro-6-deoxyglucose reductase, E3